MKKTFIIVSLAVGLGVFATCTASAQFLAKINFTGKFTYTTSSTSGSVTTYKMNNYSFNNKTLIAFFNNSSYFTNAVGTIPDKSYFVLDANSGDVIVTNKSGFSADLSLSYYSSYYDDNFTPLSVDTSGGNSVTSGKYDRTTLQENEQSISALASINVDDGWGDTISVQGLGQSKYNLSKVKNGMQNEKISGKINGSGNAEFLTAKDGYESGVVQCKASANGHGQVSAAL